MENLASRFSKYEESHRHPVNVALHKICVPAIQWSLLLMLWAIPLGPLAPLNLAWIVALLALVYYIRLDWRAAIYQGVVTVLMLWSAHVLASAGYNVFWIGLIVFVIAWIGQFVGHKIEGKKPSFFEDLLFLLIGPLWIAKRFFR